MKKLILFVVILLLITNTNHLLAQTPQEENDTTPSTVSSDDVQKLRQAVQEKVQEKLNQLINPQDTKRGIVGTISKIEATRLTLDYQNTPRTVDVDPEAVIIDLKKQKINLDKVKVGQNFLCMGNITTGGSIDAKRLVAYDPATLVRRQVVIGKIADISQSSPIMVVIPTNNKNLQYQIKTDTKTDVVNKASAKVDLKTLKAGNKVIAVLYQDPKNLKSYTALKLILMDTPQSSSPTPKPTSN